MRHFRECAGDVLMEDRPTIEITYMDFGGKGIEYVEWTYLPTRIYYWGVPKPDAQDLARGCHEDGIPHDVRQYVARLAMEVS